MRDSIRRKYIKLRNRLSAVQTEEYAVCLLDVFKNSVLDCHKTIMSYMPIKNEAPVDRINEYILNSGRQLLLPSTNANNEITPLLLKDFNDLSLGKYNIPEPAERIEIDPGCIELILVPGVAFDSKGNRIGYGKGCYDRFLTGTEAVRAGICYEFQIYEGNLPSEIHDMRMDFLLDENKIYEVKNVI